MALVSLVFFLITSCFLPPGNRACPEECRCENAESNVNCIGKSMKYLPKMPEEMVMLNLTSNRLTHLLPYTFVEMKKVEQLDLSSNGLEWIDRGAFMGMKELDKLFIENNRMGILRPNTFMGTGANLKFLTLRNGLIFRIDPGTFNGLRGVRTLDMSRNRIPRLTGSTLQGMSRLQILDLSENAIVIIEPRAFLQAANTLTEIDLGKNKLVSIKTPTFNKLRNVVKLELNDNRISAIGSCAFKGMKKLKILDLSGNFIKELRQEMFADQLLNLNHLILANNRIKFIGGDVFSDVPNLIELVLSHNSINRIHREGFRGLGNSARSRNFYLNLEYNSLETLPKKTFIWFNWEQKNIYIYLSNNPWRCDCNIQNFHSWLQDPPRNIFNSNFKAPNQRNTLRKQQLVTCCYPEQLRGYNLYSLPDVYLVCNKYLHGY